MMICAWLVVTDVYSEATDAAAGPPRGDGCARTETQSACYAEAPVAMLPSTRGRQKDRTIGCCRPRGRRMAAQYSDLCQIGIKSLGGRTAVPDCAPWIPLLARSTGSWGC